MKNSLSWHIISIGVVCLRRSTDAQCQWCIAIVGSCHCHIWLRLFSPSATMTCHWKSNAYFYTWHRICQKSTGLKYFTPANFTAIIDPPAASLTHNHNIFCWCFFFILYAVQVNDANCVPLTSWWTHIGCKTKQYPTCSAKHIFCIQSLFLYVCF